MYTFGWFQWPELKWLLNLIKVYTATQQSRENAWNWQQRWHFSRYLQSLVWNYARRLIHSHSKRRAVYRPARVSLNSSVVINNLASDIIYHLFNRLWWKHSSHCKFNTSKPNLPLHLILFLCEFPTSLAPAVNP